MNPSPVLLPLTQVTNVSFKFLTTISYQLSFFKRPLIMIIVSMSIFANAQTKKQLKQHRKLVDSSKVRNAALVSLDSFYCSGVKYAIVKRSSGRKPGYCFLNVKTKDTLIRINIISDSLGSDKVIYSHFYFPELKTECDVMNKVKEQELYELICNNKLINKNGLDTFKTETFVTLKGSYKKKLKSKKNAIDNFKMIKRNRSAKVFILGNDIYQDSTIIGSYVEIKADTVKGIMYNHLEVYNTQKQKVCFGSTTTLTSHEWRIYTNSDGKYHLIKSEAGDDKDVFNLINFLINNMYL